MVNRRNAFLGWVAWAVIKRVLRRKAKRAVPTIDTESKRPNRSALVLALAAVAGGAFWFWRQHGADEHDSPDLPA